MICLLDTHALLWFLDDSSRLSRRAQTAIWDSDGLCVSIAAMWEIAIKQAVGRLAFMHSPSEIASICTARYIHILPILPEHLDELRDLPMIHRDPFDRLMVAQARCHGCTLVTKDENIVKYDVETIW